MRTFVLICSFLALLGSTSTAAPPNVLFIAVDDLKPTLGCYGDIKAISKNIDQLARAGTVFLNNHCQQAVCGASRASLMTGQYPDTNGVRDFQTKMREARKNVLTLPQHFKNNGYQVVSMGKIYDGRCVDDWIKHDEPSWTERLNPWPKSGVFKGYLNEKTVAKLRQIKNEFSQDASKLSEAMPPTEGSEEVPDEAYVDGATAKAAVATLRKLTKKGQRPFFLAVGFDKPHLPFVAPKRYWDLFDRDEFDLARVNRMPRRSPQWAGHGSGELRYGYQVPKKGELSEELQRELIHGYYACVAYVDAQIGKVLTELEKSGAADNTIIAIWGDHGFHLGDHALWCKHSNFEQATRSPLIIKAPGQKATGRKTQSPTEFIDIFPTLCDLAGLKIPNGLEGVTLRPILDDADTSVKSLAQSQYDRIDWRNSDRKLMGYSYRGPRYRLTQWKEMSYKKGESDGPIVAEELYDYKTDPLETRNLIKDPRAAGPLKDMREEVARR